MRPTLDKLLASAVVADGGWSTQLVRRGFPATRAAELATLEAPGLVSDLARAYVAAGAEIITTNTFAANRVAAKRRRISADLGALNRTGAKLAREAADDLALVAGSIGPSGAIIAVGEIKDEELHAAFGEQAEALAAGGADLIVLETFTELAEALVALRAASEASGLPVVASMSFDSGPQRTQTIMGADAGECAAALADNGAIAVGHNCGSGIATALPVVVALRANTKLPLWVKPSAGLPDLEDGRAVYSHPPEEFAEPVMQLLDAGATVIGGCCGVGPDHIRRVSAIVRHWRKRRGRAEGS